MAYRSGDGFYAGARSLVLSGAFAILALCQLPVAAQPLDSGLARTRLPSEVRLGARPAPGNTGDLILRSSPAVGAAPVEQRVRVADPKLKSLLESRLGTYMRGLAGRPSTAGGVTTIRSLDDVSPDVFKVQRRPAAAGVSPAGKTQLDGFYSAMDGLNSRVNTQLKSIATAVGTSPEPQPRALQIATAAAERTVAGEGVQELMNLCASWLENTEEDEVRRQILTTAATAATAAQPQPGTGLGRLEPKALYGGDDTHNLCSYERIASVGRAAVAILENGESNSFCSGVLVANDLVLTAAHCLATRRGGNSAYREDVEIGNLRVRVGGFRGNWSQPSLYQVDEVLLPAQPDDALKQRIAKGDFGDDLLDLAVLRLKQPVAASDKVAPAALCAAPATIGIGHPFLMVGYPNGEAGRVLDNARALLPYRVTLRDRNEAMCKISVPLLRLKRSLAATPEDATVSKALVDVIARIEKAYQAGPDRTYRLMHPGYARGTPALAFDPDARGGDSGAPVFDRRLLCVAGVFTAGIGDVYVERANWFAHEVALPTERIVEFLKDKAPAIWQSIEAASSAAAQPSCQ